MRNQLHIKSFKKSKLIDLLLRTADKRRYHYLYLTSCYFSPQSAKNLINDLNNSIRLSEVVVYIDRKTAVSLGRDYLTTFCNSFRNVDVKMYAIDTEYLFHSKAYALISYDEDDEISCGSLVIGSANLTGNGLTNRSGNIECLLHTSDIDLLQEFVEQIDSANVLKIQDIEKFSNAEEYNFKYALLQEGAFIHKWADNLGQYLAVRYKLNDKGKEKIGDPAFKQAGFNIETATISKKYFIFDYEPPHLENAENLTRNYGIETYLGYWLPSLALETLFDQGELEEFKNRLFGELDRQMEEIKHQITQDLEYLKEENIIEITDSDPVELFDRKAGELRSNDLKLKRIFSKYEIFYLPYDIRQKEKIEELFEEMIGLCEARKKRNATMKAFIDSISLSSLNVFRERIAETIE